MNTLLRTLVILALSLVIAPAAAAQEGKGEMQVPIPEKLERPTKTDEQGLLVWAEFKAEPCVNCKGKKTMPCPHCARLDPKDYDDCPECKKTKNAPCRVCGATGEMYDVLARAPCPTCFGAGITRCSICHGAGRFPVTGGGDKPTKCNCCDAIGAFKCETCDGKRLVEPPGVKPTVGEGKSADLKKALETVDAMLAAAAKFESTGDGRKDIKEYDKVLAAGAKWFPPLKRAQKHFEEATKKQSKGAVWKHYNDAVKEQAASAKEALTYYLKHQKRVLELCLARAEHNEPLLAQKKK